MWNILVTSLSAEYMSKTSSGPASSPNAVGSVDENARMNALANAAFAREVRRKVTDVILPLNDNGTGPAFYCVHSITGAATGFCPMAKMLGPKQRFFGIQTPTNKRNAEFASSIETISRYYVDRLTSFQPEGNFILAGHSVGAVIALEMAQQLRARGREVSLVVVFDGELFNTGTEISSRNPLYWLKLILNVPRWTRDFLMVEFTFKSFCQTVLKKATAAGKTITAKISGRGLGSGHAVEGFINLNNCTPDHAEFMKTLYEIQFAYVPKEYSGRVLVCVAKTQALTHLRQVEVVWRAAAPAAEVVHFKATHTSMMRAPEGLPIAEYLTRLIAQLDPQFDSAAATSRRANVGL
jgi:thioesterase domain-containing protein